MREAQAADMADVLAIYEAAGVGTDVAFSEAEAVAQLARFRQYPALHVFVATVGGRTVGTYELLLMDNLAKRGRRSAIVEDVAVDPAFQGRGIGRVMMEHARAQARAGGCYKLTLSSNLRREAAHRFYESLGFTRHGYSFRVDVEEQQ